MPEPARPPRPARRQTDGGSGQARSTDGSARGSRLELLGRGWRAPERRCGHRTLDLGGRQRAPIDDAGRRRTRRRPCDRCGRLGALAVDGSRPNRSSGTGRPGRAGRSGGTSRGGPASGSGQRRTSDRAAGDRATPRPDGRSGFRAGGRSSSAGGGRSDGPSDRERAGGPVRPVGREPGPGPRGRTARRGAESGWVGGARRRVAVGVSTGAAIDGPGSPQVDPSGRWRAQLGRSHRRATVAGVPRPIATVVDRAHVRRAAARAVEGPSPTGTTRGRGPSPTGRHPRSRAGRWPWGPGPPTAPAEAPAQPACRHRPGRRAAPIPPRVEQQPEARGSAAPRTGVGARAVDRGRRRAGGSRGCRRAGRLAT